MNTATKIILILAAPLIAISCAPADAELSSRNWGEVNTPKQTYTSSTYQLTYAGGPMVNDPEKDDYSREIVISFHNSADVLRESNANIEAKLKTFLTIYTYKGGDEGIHKDGYHILADENIQAYSFVERRVVNADKTQVRISLDKDVPLLNMVAKVDATKYTFRGGLKLDLNGDKNFGEAIYDDDYLDIEVDDPSEDPDPVPFIRVGNAQDWVLEINFSGTGDPTDAPDLDAVAILSGFGLDKDIKEELDVKIDLMKNKIMPLLVLQKFDGQQWVGTEEEFLVNDDGELELKDFEPKSTVNYRIYASGLKNLKVGEYWGANQMVKVSSDGDTATFSRNTIVSQSKYWYKDTDFDMQEDPPIDFTDSFVTFDRDGTNVVLHLRFKEIEGAYLTKMELEDFNKYFKIVYPLSSFTGNVEEAENLSFIGVKAVEYSTTFLNEGKPDTDKLDTITVYLDSNYRLSAEDKYIFIAPGFKYNGPGPGHGQVTFGDFANINVELGGVNCFKSYGKFGLTF